MKKKGKSTKSVWNFNEKWDLDLKMSHIPHLYSGLKLTDFCVKVDNIQSCSKW